MSFDTTLTLAQFWQTQPTALNNSPTTRPTSSRNNNITISNPPNHPPAVNSYSHISTTPLSPTKTLISFAGQTYISATKPTPTPDFRSQVGLALANVDKCLAAAGLTKDDIVSNRQYCVKLQDLSQEDQDARSDLFVEWWNDGRREGEERLTPPDTLIGVDSLASKDILFEIEVTCVASAPAKMWYKDALQSTAVGIVGLIVIQGFLLATLNAMGVRPPGKAPRWWGRGWDG